MAMPNSERNPQPMGQEGPDDRTGYPPLVGWLWRTYLKKHLRLIILAASLMAIEGGTLGAISYMIRPMFDEVFIAGNRDAVSWVALSVAGIFIVRAFAAFGHRIVMQGVGLNVIAAMQRDMTRHLLTLDSAYFQANSPGTLIERVRGDTSVANQIWGVILSAAGRDVVSLIALLAVAVSVDWLWTLIAIAGAPLLLGPVLWLQKFVRKSTRAARVAAGVLSTRLDEIFHGVNTIKLNTSETREAGRFDRSVRGYLRQELLSRIGQAAIPVLTDLVAAIGFFGVLTYGGLQIIEGEKTVGEFMSFFTAMGLIFEPLRRVANVTGAWQAARASLERIQDVFHVGPTILSPASPAPAIAAPETADIVLDNVTLRYGSDPVLRGTGFTAVAGETTALVGPSGAGKSTIFNTLTRLVDPESGKIEIGGVSTRDLSLPDLRKLFSVVTQDAPMFDESIRDNIILNTDDVSDAALADAVEAANLTEFIETLPNGLDSLAGPRGSNLSGGQRQRVAIARALVRNAPILLLDEATSALDSASEAKVQAALDRLSDGRTTLVIAHRLATIRKAHKIVVMESGQVIDQGRHEELLERGGVYSVLHQLQFSQND